MRTIVIWVSMALFSCLCLEYSKDSVAIKIALKELSADKGELENLSVELCLTCRKMIIITLLYGYI